MVYCYELEGSWPLYSWLAHKRTKEGKKEINTIEEITEVYRQKTTRKKVACIDLQETSV